MNRTVLTDIEWDKVEMEPLAGNYHAEGPVVINDHTRLEKAATGLVVGKTVVSVGFFVLKLTCSVAIMVFGVKVMNGSMPAPEMSYEMVMGLILVVFGLSLLRMRARV